MFDDKLLYPGVDLMTSFKFSTSKIYWAGSASSPVSERPAGHGKDRERQRYLTSRGRNGSFLHEIGSSEMWPDKREMIRDETKWFIEATNFMLSEISSHRDSCQRLTCQSLSRTGCKQHVREVAAGAGYVYIIFPSPIIRARSCPWR